MIHKIEIFPHYTYPITSHDVCSIGKGNNEQTLVNYSNTKCGEDTIMGDDTKLHSINSSINTAANFSPPYRTVSHYGFNYPCTYTPHISLHPACCITPVNLQRQKVIAFIKRLNLAASEQQLGCFQRTKSVNVDGDSKIVKEENIYENAINRLDNNKVMMFNTAESFISVAEIQLNAVKQKPLPKSYKNHQNTHSAHLLKNTLSKNNPAALQSNEFSSLHSISGTYPALSQSQIEDAENDHCTTDSGYNLSNFELQSSRKCTQDNLYRSYLQRNFIPEVINSHHSIIDFRDRDDEPDPHKPESEQQSQNNIKQSSKYIRNNENKHITLTLNSLKRRASSLCEKKEKSKNHDKLFSTQTSFRTQFSDGNSSCDSSTTSTAIEIHINVNIRNSDCIKSLQNHEQEFKSKLEKVIDDEINLITQELALSPQCDVESKETTSFHLTSSHRCLSAPENISLYGRDPFRTEVDRHSSYNLNEAADIAQLSTMPSNSYARKYRETLTILEHELEILLNSIIRNMCDCKDKIAQISEDIRTATLHVGSLNRTSSKDAPRADN